MNKLLATVAALALLASPALAQQSATSGSTSGSSSGSISNAQNNASVGNTSSSSDSGAVSGSLSSSVSRGGTATSDAHATGGVASAVTGPSSAVANPTATNAGNEQAITFNSTNPDSIRTVPQVYAPALTTTLTETCMGSTSGGGSWLGGGLTFGTSWRDEECTRRLTARELSQTLGDREAARAILCGNKAVLEAYDRLGRPCPQSPLYKVSQAGLYMPQLPAPPAPPPPAPPVVVNVPAPAAATVVQMQPIPNPPAPAPVHRRHSPAKPQACAVGPKECHG